MNPRFFQLTRALNHPIRIQILNYLMNHGESNVTTLVQQVNVTQPAVSRHLRLLLDANLVSDRQAGKEKLYQLADTHVIEILALMNQHITEL
ncbi:ArsR/SmtB family transcription factor [Lentilactobacillus parakefiri]|uniref:Transcriptional regulator n=1 Tax=Lentilactobacillus parakefiri TaxID=152332 RepID=A0A269XVQ6_9LACO|nr:metalloregulator ArsR/SmtB family transcription factor [Lentilactobacillus parakefiri]PAK77368.1 transcriptional regulator [Lentilactobacillus parakefiri]PAL00232.1 transcriptional regulator [Lentilactobacillus parakefiri]